jgi:hypothetical protein
MMDYGLESPDSILGRGKKFVSSPQGPDRLWGPLNLISKGYLELLSRG